MRNEPPRKKLLAVTSGIVSMSGRLAATHQEMTGSVLGRIHALTQYSLIQRTVGSPGEILAEGTLQSVIETILRPYEDAGSKHEQCRSRASRSATSPLLRSALGRRVPA
jgi:hypothetical protein